MRSTAISEDKMREGEGVDTTNSSLDSPRPTTDWSWYDPATEQRVKRRVFLIAMPIALGLALAGSFWAAELFGSAVMLPTYLILSTVFLALGTELEPPPRPQDGSVARRVIRRAMHLAVATAIVLLVLAAVGRLPQ